MITRLLMIAASAFALLVFVGCSLLHHIMSRRVTSGEWWMRRPISPLPGKVKRVVPDYEAGTMDQVKGGEILERTRAVQTGADGRFDVDSQKSVSLFRDLAWFTVEFSFDHRYYEPFVTNYTPRFATNSPSGEPVIYAGEILMTPKSKEP